MIKSGGLIPARLRDAFIRKKRKKSKDSEMHLVFRFDSGGRTRSSSHKEKVEDLNVSRRAKIEIQALYTGNCLIIDDDKLKRIKNNKKCAGSCQVGETRGAPLSN